MKNVESGMANDVGSMTRPTTELCPPGRERGELLEGSSSDDCT